MFQTIPLLFFYKGSDVFWSYFLFKLKVNNKEVRSDLIKDYFKIHHDEMIRDLIDYKYIVIDLRCKINPFMENNPFPHNPLLDI